MTDTLRTRRALTAILAAVVLAGTLYIGARSVGGAPALGRFLDPVHGVWAVAAHAELPAQEQSAIPALRAPVDVRYDDRGVPHIFAANTSDAYRALGWIHARDRLFQMELQTRAVAGTLSELVGIRALTLDREARAQGLAWSAERNAAFTDSATETGRAVLAYTDGVNAYISTLSNAALPLEYHLLGAHPLRWQPVHSAYLLARMGLTLAYSDWELRRMAVDALVGKAATDALFPANSPIQEPIQPNGQRAPRLDWRTIPPPHPTDSTKLAMAHDMMKAFALGTAFPPGGESAVGSNNWAVAPRRTAGGSALLAGDPHLRLTLPSIWYEAHLVVPDTLDVYGVTLPGAPFVTVGFNRDFAWSPTNTGADVADYYVETVDDRAHPTRYQVDGAWKAITPRVEIFRDRRGTVLATDTIYHTHRGPMLRVGPRWVSRRWTVTEPADAAGPFHALNRAKSVAEGLRSTDAYTVPAQNFAMADRGGHIALRSTGHFPIRGISSPPADMRANRASSPEGRGDILLDGSTSVNDWRGWWPIAEYPQAMDPAQGYVASANQQPKDPRVDPRYLGVDWAAPWRAMRINALLRADSAVTPDAMRQFQTDPYSAQPAFFVPAFLHAVETAPGARDSALVRGGRALAEWDGRFTKDNERAVLYETAIQELTRRTWDELQIPDSTAPGKKRFVETPRSDILAELLQDPKNPWWDDRSTVDVVEDRDAILRASLAAAYTKVVQEHGPPGPGWRWSGIRHTNIMHLMRIPAFSRMDVSVQAGASTLSPSSGDGSHGASWRMVVELGPQVRAWGVYPGGQSGNPISARYDDRLAKWANGELDTLRFPKRAGDLTGRMLMSVLRLTPGRR